MISSEHKWFVCLSQPHRHWLTHARIPLFSLCRSVCIWILDCCVLYRLIIHQHTNLSHIVNYSRMRVASLYVHNNFLFSFALSAFRIVCIVYTGVYTLSLHFCVLVLVCIFCSQVIFIFWIFIVFSVSELWLSLCACVCIFLLSTQTLTLRQQSSKLRS